MKLLTLLSPLALCLLLVSQSTMAQSTTTKKTTTSTAPAIKTAPGPDEDDMIPDLKDSATYEYHCDMKDFLTIYSNASDNDHIALRWKNRIYRLKRIATTTGANRFENKKAGLVWIGIPSKGMLLDSIHGQQLANECKTTGQ